MNNIVRILGGFEIAVCAIIVNIIPLSFYHLVKMLKMNESDAIFTLFTTSFLVTFVYFTALVTLVMCRIVSKNNFVFEPEETQYSKIIDKLFNDADFSVGTVVYLIIQNFTIMNIIFGSLEG